VGAVLLWLDVTEREQRERLRQEFSANVSHELKTPLTSISGFAELMAQGTVPPDKVVEFSAEIQRQSLRLITLVQDIIKLSKLDEGAKLPEPEPVDLLELGEDVLDSLRSVAEKQGLRLRAEGEAVRIMGVWQLLNEMVYNLCDNAIKYNRPGGSVTLTTGRLDGSPFLRVSDTGIGIPEQEQGRVFERFYRVDKSHSKQIGGTGLGLSIVKHGAQYHGARVSLESKPGVGTAVTLIFPNTDPEPAEAD
jgi:two-component system phosphate regulon sensor histidine kinase PhoR